MYTTENYAEDLAIAQEVCRIHFRGFRHLHEDMIQEAVVKLWQKRPEFKGGSAYKTFATRIAKNAMLDFLRKEYNHLNFDISIFHEVGENETYMDILPDLLMDIAQVKLIKQVETMRYDITRNCVERCLRLFNDGEKKVITLLLKNLTYREIEQRLGVSKSYVGNLAKRFRSEVAKELNEFVRGTRNG